MNSGRASRLTKRSLPNVKVRDDNNNDRSVNSKSLLLSANDKRIDGNVNVVYPIVIGSCSYWLGVPTISATASAPLSSTGNASSASTASQQASSAVVTNINAGSASHKWTIYVRSIDGMDDLSKLIDKVIFQLHPSCSQPLVVVDSPPFQVSQTGWGEFEAVIRIVLKDPRERPVDISHVLRLFPINVHDASSLPAIASDQQSNLSMTKPVVSEIYDEIVIRNPYVSFYQSLQSQKTDGSYILANKSQSSSTTSEDSIQSFSQYWYKFSDEKDMSIIKQAHHHIKEKLEQVMQDLSQIDSELMVEYHKQYPSSDKPSEITESGENYVTNE